MLTVGSFAGSHPQHRQDAARRDLPTARKSARAHPLDPARPRGAHRPGGPLHLVSSLVGVTGELVSTLFAHR
eukprot:804233-Prorocentrum_minimum.AAC.1